MSVILDAEVSENRFHVHLNNLHSTTMTFNTFLEREPMEKLQSLIPVAQGATVRTVAQENFQLLLIFGISVQCLDSSFSVLQMLEVVQGTTEYNYFRD